MPRRMSIDLETFSTEDLKKSGLYRYVQSPDFQILLFAYSIDWGPVEVIDLAQGEQIPDHVVQALFDPTVTKHAYNASFEWYCLSKYFNLPHPEAWLNQWQCTMIHGMYLGYPGKLSAVGEALGLPEDKKKLSVGLSLIRTFCVPQRPTKNNGNRTRTLPQHEPEKWELFKEYCRQDVVTEMEVAKRLERFPMPEREWTLWRLDQVINLRGVAVDMDVVHGALAIDEQLTSQLIQEAVALTGVDNPNSVKQLTRWLSEEIGEEVEDLRKKTVEKLLAKVDEDKVRRVLEIRQQLSKTSVKKYQAIVNTVCADGRIRGLFQFYGANRTGRWAGRLVQVQNLPRNNISHLGMAREFVKQRKVDHIQLVYGNVADVLSQLIRTAFVPKPGHKLVVCDFSSIEARVVAWLAGEEWRLEVFRTHGKIYEASASQMFGVPIEQITKGSDLRQKGKIAELALGYQGGVGALVSMGALDMGLSKEELEDIVQRWRAANRRIVDLWRGLENAAIYVMQTGQAVGIRGLILAREYDPVTGQDFFTIQLPSGRKLYYPKPFLAENKLGKAALHYHTKNGSKWEPTSTYGGKLTENVVQAISRDCLAEALLRLHANGHHVVMHIHDEIVNETPDSAVNVEAVERLMAEPMPWAPDLPLGAEGFVADFYQKG